MSPLDRIVSDVMTAPATTVRPDERLDVALALMSACRIRHLPVDDAGDVVGMLSLRDVYRVDLSHLTARRGERALHLRGVEVGQMMTQPVLTTAWDTPLLDAARVLLDRKISSLPVMDRERLRGIITRTDFLDVAAEVLFTEVRAHDAPVSVARLMTPWPILVLAPDDRLDVACSLMRSQRLHHLPVVHERTAGRSPVRSGPPRRAELPNQRRLPVHELPTGEAKLRLLEQAQRRLGSLGYRTIGFDHFALPDDELARALYDGTLWRDFQGYTTRRGPATIAVGVTGISDLGGAYAQNGKSIAEYTRAIGDGRLYTERGIVLTEDDRRRRAIIVDLLCNGRADLGEDAAATFARELDALRAAEQDGLVLTDGRFVRLTALGRTFARNVAMAFDAYPQRRERRAFSQTI